MVDSIQSLIEVRPVLDEMLQGQAIALTDEEWEILIELTTILEPCKVVVEALCREDADLLSAEISLKWLFTTLENIGNPLALELSEEFKVEIEKRWPTDTPGLLKYLNDPDKIKPPQPQQLGRNRTKRQKISDNFKGSI